MKLPNLPLKKLTAAIGTCLVLGVSGPMLAQTDLVVENDGLMLSALVNSSTQDVLSMSIRVVGPEGFVFEDRVENGAIEWFPAHGLPDGVYHWEVWSVTLDTSAQALDSMIDRQQPPTAEELATIGIPEASIGEIKPPPLERFYKDRDKSVIRDSGSFRISNGWLEEINDEFDNSLSRLEEAGILRRAFGSLLDFLVPSAHAEEVFTDNIRIDKGAPSIYFDVETGDREWRLWVGTQTGDLYFSDESQGASTSNAPIRVEKGSPNNSIRVRGFGSRPFVGIGTETPTNTLHLSSSLASIRLERSASQSWYVNNRNQGLFQINSGDFTTIDCGGANCFVNPFTIEPPPDNDLLKGWQDNALVISPTGQVSIKNPTGGSADLHVGGGYVGIETDTANSFFPGSITTDNYTQAFTMRVVGSTFGIEEGTPSIFGTTRRPFRVTAGAPSDSLRIASSGNVGVGTGFPSEKLHVRASDGSAALLVQETAASNQQRLLTLQHEGAPLFVLEDTAQSTSWTFRTGGTVGTASEGFIISKIGTGVPEMLVGANGDMQIQGTLTELSSRDRKMNIETPAYASILDKIDRLDVPQWSYINSPGSVHIGPIAQDFHSLFGYGLNDETISPRNIAGVALAAVKALRAENNELKRQLADYADLKQRVAALESRSDHEKTIHVSY